MPQPPRPPDKTLADKDAASEFADEIVRQDQEISKLKEKLYGSKPPRHNEKHIVRRLRDYEYEAAGPETLRGLRSDAADTIVFERVVFAAVGVILLGLPFLASWFGFTPTR